MSGKKMLIRVLIILVILAFMAPCALGEDRIRINKGFQDETGISFLINLMDDTGASLGSGADYNAEAYDAWVQNADNPVKADSVDSLVNAELGTHYYVCVDVSKTVSKDEMESIKTVLTQFFLSINPSAVTFNKASLWKFGEHVTPLIENSSDAVSLNQAVQNLSRDEQWTHLFEVIYSVTEKARARDNTDNPVVIIITDGEDDQGNNVVFTYDAIAHMVEESGVPMYGIMLPVTTKRNPNTTELYELCRKSGGNLQQMNTSVSAELPTMLSRIREIADAAAVVHVPMYNDGTITKSNADFRLGLVDGNRSLESGAYTVINLTSGNWPAPTPEPTPVVSNTPEVMRTTPVPTEVVEDKATEEVIVTFAPDPEPEPEPEPTDFVTWVKDHLAIVGGAALALIVLIVLIVALSPKKKRGVEMVSTNNRHNTNMDDIGTVGPGMRSRFGTSDDDGTLRGVSGSDRGGFGKEDRSSSWRNGSGGTYRPMDDDPFAALKKNQSGGGSGTVYMKGNDLSELSATGTVRMDEPKPMSIRVTERRDMEGYSEDHVLSLRNQLTVGRGETCDYVIRDDKVSGKHLIIKRELERVTITDDKSTNGTRLNGNPVTFAQELHSGDIVVIGMTTLVFHFDV